MKRELTESLSTPIGTLLLTDVGGALARVGFDERGSSGRDPNDANPRESLAETRTKLAQYFAGEPVAFEERSCSFGTAFQQKVWRALAAIPFGETRSYQQIAHAIGRPRAVRAVGAAIGKNPLAIVVPCHRVIGARGALTGFFWGIGRKRWLLEHEARVVLAARERKATGKLAVA